MFDQYPMFDSHLHIIDRRFPLVENNGFTPDEFTCADYLRRMKRYNLCGGAVVSGSFQSFDQTYLIDALKKLGPSFVGVTQLPFSVTDEEIVALNEQGVRAVRFNLKRGGSESVEHLVSMASRVYELAGWHVELYVDSKDLPDLYSTLMHLPAASVDHLGLSGAEFRTLVKLAECGVKVKATGFGRVDFPVADALRSLYDANPNSLIFGTDLPSTRAPRHYLDEDFELVIETLGPAAAKKVLRENAISFYKLNFQKTAEGCSHLNSRL